jgi:hypothetical protein
MIRSTGTKGFTRLGSPPDRATALLNAARPTGLSATPPEHTRSASGTVSYMSLAKLVTKTGADVASLPHGTAVLVPGPRRSKE